MKSLSRWMLLSLLAVVTLGGISSGYTAYRVGLTEARELFDAKLAQSARVLRGLVDASLPARHGEPQPPLVIALWSGSSPDEDEARFATKDGHVYETKLSFQVWSEAEAPQLLLRSDNAPEQPLAPLRAGFHDLLIGDARWRSFALRADSGRWYLAGEREDVRGEIAAEIAEGILLPLLIELPLLALLIWGVIRVGERSLQRVTAEVGSRAVDALQPIGLDRVPVEIASLVTAINRLLAVLDAALQRERRFTADAAHELRTPVSALRLQLSNLLAAPDVDSRAQAGAQLQRALQRLDRLLAQLLTLSRLEPGVPLPESGPVDLTAVTREAISELVNAGLGAEIELELQAEPGLRVQGDAVSLGVLVRNLVDNALRYTPAGGRVQVTLERQDEALELRVEDSGPGIPEAAHQRVLERFHRELGSGVEGSGLGLSIVERVAQIHAAELRFSRSPTLGGLQVLLRFPRPTGD